jgi:hypothetical protein
MTRSFMLCYSSPDIVRVIKSRRNRWAVHVASMWERRGAYWVFMGKSDVKRHLEDVRIAGSIILKWILSSGTVVHSLIACIDIT